MIASRNTQLCGWIFFCYLWKKNETRRISSTPCWWWSSLFSFICQRFLLYTYATFFYITTFVCFSASFHLIRTRTAQKKEKTDWLFAHGNDESDIGLGDSRSYRQFRTQSFLFILRCGNSRSFSTTELIHTHTHTRIILCIRVFTVEIKELGGMNGQRLESYVNWGLTTARSFCAIFSR